MFAKMNARYISILSRARGIGKTTVALNLGMALQKIGQKTIVLDADFSKPNMIEHLDMDYLPITLEDVFNGNNHIYDTIYRHPSGLKIIPSMTLEDYSKLQYHLPELQAEYDYVILDTPFDMQGLNQVLAASDEAIIVHSPTVSSRQVIVSAKALKKNNVLNLGIVLNRGTEDSAGSVFDLPIIAKIPFHKDVERSYRLKHPVVYTHPNAKASKAFIKLADKIVV